jgi:NAD(P)-dependent dehydrogenase (short-subunit alcohol dehydrogenase family)
MFASRVLAGQTALVTGGGTGIGLSIAIALGRLGARVAIASRDSDHLEAGLAELRSAGCEATAVEVDVRKPDQVDAMVAATLSSFGRIDILVNNAAGNFVCRAEDLTPNGWNAVIGIVLNGSFYASRAVGRHMIARGGGGSIVSILANYAWTGSPGTIHSASAKAGVMAMTQTLAVEWAPHRIRVNAVAPGPIESPGAARQLWSTQAAVDRITSAVPLGRWGRADEIADAVSFLVSPHASYITGEIMTVDGGQWLGRGTFDFLSLGVTKPDSGAR